MNNKPHTVIGVLPDFPQYPQEADIYITVNNCPFRSAPAALATRNSFRGLSLIGQLKPGVQPSQANADISTLASGFVQEYPDAYKRAGGFAASVVPMQEELTHNARPTFLILLGTAGLVLLIACANVANLTLARLMRRDREMAVRTALGANRSRLVKQLLTESILMSLVGGGLGLLIASRGLPLLVTFAGRFTNRTSDIKLDFTVLIFTLGISVLTGIVFGLLPAFSKRADLTSALKEGGRGSSAGHRWVRNTLVVAQVGVSFVLLIGAGLMLRTLINIQQVSPGFNPEKVLVMRLTPSFTKFNTNQATQNLFDRILTAMKSQPGVEMAALSSSYPLNSLGITRGPNTGNFLIEGRPVADGQLTPQADAQSASPDFFRAVGISLVKGRFFTDADNATAPPVVVVNQSLARHRWENEDPIGRRISFDNGTTWLTIVGIAGDTKWYGLNQEAPDQMFVPVAQGGAGYLVLKTQTDPMQMSKQIRDALLKTDGDTAVDRINNLEDAMSDSVASPRLMAGLLGLFAVVALLITVAGIIGVISLSVTQRTQELGIRMALGASQTKVMGMVMSQGMALVLIGLAIGTFGSVLLTFVVGSMISPLLFSVKTIDPATFVGVSVVLMLVAAFACFVPARRVTGIDPMIALRRE
jgi:predicted permease